MDPACPRELAQITIFNNRYRFVWKPRKQVRIQRAPEILQTLLFSILVILFCLQKFIVLVREAQRAGSDPACPRKLAKIAVFNASYHFVCKFHCSGPRFGSSVPQRAGNLSILFGPVSQTDRELSPSDDQTQRTSKHLHMAGK